MAQVADSDVGLFSARFTGKLMRPDDPDYDRARSVWNGAINRRPALIARGSTSEDVAAAIQFGSGKGLEISVRGGGHNFAVLRFAMVG